MVNEMKILMTGITGFIGKNLAERLLNNGHEVFAIVRPTSKIDELSKNLQDNVKFFTYDADNTVLDIVTDLCVEDNRPDVVYHLASWLLTTEHKFEDIKDLIQSNITFGTELLDAMTANNLYNFVNADTMLQHFDDAAYSPSNLYAATKQCFDDIIVYYKEARQLKCISLCIFGTYGSNDKGRIFALLKKIADSGETLKMSPGGQLVDFVYIDDVVDAFILAGDYLAKNQYDYCGTYGVSSMNPIPLRSVVEIFEEVSGKKLSIEWGGRPYRQREVMITWTNFKTLPGWEAKINLREGIAKLLQSN